MGQRIVKMVAKCAALKCDEGRGAVDRIREKRMYSRAWFT